ncbi:MAG: hypothetical protein HQ502_07805 [Alphaproteobacteria bacterium]|nr:hypothetical protein [Alphaproteobacteria bacterium]
MNDNEVPHLKCDVELAITGPNDATLNKRAADTLRGLADRIENDEFEDGHHPVEDSVGKSVGTIYVEYFDYEEIA